jgi:hypothetical protein
MIAAIRTIKEFDLDEVSRHLLVVGDLTGDCFNCKELGLDYLKIKSCPKCKTEFRFITSRKSNIAGLKPLSDLHKRRPDLVCIELYDFKQHKDREKAKDFFS